MGQKGGAKKIIFEEKILNVSLLCSITYEKDVDWNSKYSQKKID